MKQDTEPAPHGETTTPRTDAEVRRLHPIGSWGFDHCSPEFARTLERENQRLRDALKYVGEKISHSSDCWVYKWGKCDCGAVETRNIATAALSAGGTADAVAEG